VCPRRSAAFGERLQGGAAATELPGAVGHMAATGGGVGHGGVQRKANLCQGSPSVSAKVELLQLDDHSGPDPAIRLQFRQLPSHSSAVR